MNTAECARLVRFAIVCSLSWPMRATNGSRSSTYRRVQISGATSFARALEAQLPIWKERDRLSDESRGGDAESRPNFDRENVAAESTSGRTGPPENLRVSRGMSPSSVDESAEFSRCDEPASGVTPRADSAGTIARSVMRENASSEKIPTLKMRRMLRLDRMKSTRLF